MGTAYRDSMYFSASRAAVVPSAAAVVSWRISFSRTSPAAKTPGEIGAAVLAGEDAAALCHLDLALEEVGVRHDADVDEDGVDGQLALLPFALS